jgi:hypothetical protein
LIARTGFRPPLLPYRFSGGVYKQVGEAQAVQILIAQKYLSGFETITKGGSDKVFLPNSFHGLFSIGTEKSEK